MQQQLDSVIPLNMYIFWLHRGADEDDTASTAPQLAHTIAVVVVGIGVCDGTYVIVDASTTSVLARGMTSRIIFQIVKW